MVLLHVPSARTDLGTKAFMCAALLAWNSLTFFFKLSNLVPLHVFKARIGEMLFDIYTCYLLEAFTQSDLHSQYCGQSPQEQFAVKCLQGHNDMLTAVGFERGFEPVTP